MKKLFMYTLFAALLTFVLLVTTSAAEKTVYVADGGSGDGSSTASPVGTLTAAYAALGDEGGVIELCEAVTLSATFTEPAHAGLVTIRGGSLSANGIRYILHGPTKFEAVTFCGSGSFLLFVAQFHPITMGEGIKCVGYGDFSIISKCVSILGGVQSGADKYATVTHDLDSHIEIHSGKFLLVAFSRQCSHNYTGMAHIDIYGGDIYNCYLGAANNGLGGDVKLNIYGGNFLGTIFSSSTTACKAGGDMTVTVKGGDFSKLVSFDGSVSEGRTSVLDMTAKNDTLDTSKLSGFTKVLTDAGEITMQNPNDVFASGTFTATDGTTIPYRYYLPEGYATSGKTYPVVLYMHGNGSRGTDNKTQLTTNGAALLNAIFNSGNECIILAPQCPASPNQWVTDYPGSVAFAKSLAADDFTADTYLSAAAELLTSYLDSYPADTSRVYITGSSNGGGATWSLVARYPHLFAAAVPLAGTGSTGGAEAIASTYVHTPIYTFHGSADTTLSVEGTRQMVTAIKAAGGNITYTEIAGGSHNIWANAAAEAGLVDWIFTQKNDQYENPLSKTASTDTPVETTVAPAQTTVAPTETTVAPTETTDRPSATAVAPVETAEEPTVTAETPASPAEGGVRLGLILSIALAVCAALAIAAFLLFKKK